MIGTIRLRRKSVIIKEKFAFAFAQKDQNFLRYCGALGSIYTKRQRQCCDNFAMTLEILFSLKTMESLQNGVAIHFQVTLLFWMRRESLASLQSCLDVDAWCKWTLNCSYCFVTWCTGVEWCESVVINNRYLIINVETSQFETLVKVSITFGKDSFTWSVYDFNRLMGHSRGRIVCGGSYINAILLTAASKYEYLIFGVWDLYLLFLTCQYIAFLISNIMVKFYF